MLDDRPPKATPEPAGPDLPDDPAVLLGLSGKGDEIVQQGTAKVRIGIVDIKRGTVRVVPGRDRRPALDFPAYTTDDADYPRAVVAVSNAGREDQLNPGTKDFMWGADLRLDDKSYGTGGVDNGDNLVQRGTSGQSTLFKAELDKDRAACTVRGDQGELIVRASERVRPGWWYRVRCERRAAELAVFVTEYDPNGDSHSYASRVSGVVGDVSWTDPTIPLTVGGKIGEDGDLIASATDQFNGLVMYPYYATLP